MASGGSRDMSSDEPDGRKHQKEDSIQIEISKVQKVSAENTVKTEPRGTDRSQCRLNMDTEGQPQAPEGNQEKRVTEDAPDLKDLINKTAKTEKWFKTNIKRKECVHFVNSPDSSDGRVDVCECGNARSQHKYEDKKHTEKEWNQEKHIEEMPTDAFGDLKFKGQEIKTSKYVRASNSTPPEVLYDMMTHQWKLSKPKLVISVTGGANNFLMNPLLKKLFSRGLVKAAQRKGAWIITGGCHTGVAKLVGEAVRDFTRSGKEHPEIFTIGIAPWGAVQNRDRLIRKEGGHSAKYHVDVNNQGGLCCLDNNHSHFILVDDGTQGRYGVEIQLRTELERFISEQTRKEEGEDSEIPIVCVVLAGGLTTLDVIDKSLKKNTPCVIVEGSGLVADLIAQMADTSLPSLDLIKDNLRSLFLDKYEEKKISTYAKKIQGIVHTNHLLYIFRKDKGRARDFDVTKALLKASQNKDYNNRDSQLKLAVLWNHLDIAKNDIFNSECTWKPDDLYPFLTLALIENRPDFVQLFLDQGVSLRDYVTEKILTDLYSKIQTTSSFHQKLEQMQKIKKKPQDGNQKYFNRSEVKKALKSLCRFTAALYSPTEPQAAGDSTPQSTPNPLRLPAIEYLIRDLLIWAVVQNRGELAQIIWTECQDCVVGALACSKIFRALSDEEKDTNDAEEMKALADRFDERASGVFSECYRRNEERAEELLNLKSFGWGGTTCMELAASSDTMNFMSNGGVQNYLTKMWYGRLSEHNYSIRLFICMVFFPLICTGFITFRGKESDKLPPLKRLSGFFTAPVVVFYYNIVSYISFLLLFAYVLMMDLQTTASWGEILLYVWVGSLLLEELRQLFQDKKGTQFRTYAWMYISDFWNVMDVLAIGLFIVGLGFRWITTLFYTGRVILAVDYIVFCLRLMDDFTVNRVLGPKIIMMEKMIKDLYFFLFLLVVWVVSFGVSKQVILVHNEQRFYWIVRKVIYEPYLLLFGQIPTDVDTLNFNNNTCTSDGSDASLPKCVETLDGVPIFPEWLTIVLLCLYLLFAIILLLNLLIAMFNHTFSEVQGNTDKFWKFQRQKLIEEYSKRPTIPPPLILLNYLFNLYYLVKKLLPKKENRDEGSNSISVLLSWEEEMKINYLEKQQEEQSQSTDMKIRDTYNKIDAVAKLQKNVTAIEQRLIQQEEQVYKGLKEIMKSLSEKRLASEKKVAVMESSRPQIH